MDFHSYIFLLAFFIVINMFLFNFFCHTCIFESCLYLFVLAMTHIYTHNIRYLDTKRTIIDKIYNKEEGKKMQNNKKEITQSSRYHIITPHMPYVVCGKRQYKTTNDDGLLLFNVYFI